LEKINGPFCGHAFARAKVAKGTKMASSKLLATALVAGIVAAPFQLAGNGAGFVSKANAQNDYDIANVVKMKGIAWFNRMDEGIQQYARDTGVNTFQVGPDTPDPVKQAEQIEILIEQKVDAITVVPNSVDELEAVLRRARDEGIVVITHEAATQRSSHYDIEAFVNEDFGAALMTKMAGCMGERGEYAVFVGSLASLTHNQWVNGAIAKQKEAFPKMTLVGYRNETFDGPEAAYLKAKQVLKAFPKIKGIQGSASTDVAGIGRAVQEAGLEDEVCVFGASLPSIAGEYLKTGAVDGIGFWDPSVAGYAMSKVAQMVLDGDPVIDGMDLGLPGYENITLDGRVIYGKAFHTVTKENMHEYPF
jgi:simple sugar transport system substrate-binding protein